MFCAIDRVIDQAIVRDRFGGLKATLSKSFLDVFSGRESGVTGLALAQSITIDSRAAHLCVAATLSFQRCLKS
jgi:hypothetical protein